MSKDRKGTEKCFTIAVNGVSFVNVENIENAVSMALGLHKMSNLSHKIIVTDSVGSQVVVLRYE